MANWNQRSTFATLPRTTRGMPIVLGGDPKGKNFLYTNGNSVIIRNIENPYEADIYTQHSVPTTVAKYSPSGFYIASADQSGKVRIWDTVNKEHILKNEFQPFAGPIKDLVWSSDNQRICVVGEGREKFGHVFNAETGTSVGEILGQSKSLNSVDMRPSRPFRIVTASEDNTLAFFEGPPFKFKFTMNDHQRFVNVVRYSPNGELFISGGADGKSFIYDGKTGELKGELGSPAHKGGIYGVSFSDDSTKVLTVSGDKTAKIWDVAAASMIAEFIMGTTVNDMQVGCLWQGNHIITVSLSGFINYLDINNPDKPLRVVTGHNKPITALAVCDDNSTIFTAGVDGDICYWNAQSGDNNMFTGKGHKSQVQDLVIKDDSIYSCAMDDTVMENSLTDKRYGTPVQLPSQPQKMGVTNSGLQIVACAKEIVCIRGQQKVFTFPASYEPSCIAIHNGQTDVAVGGKDNKVRIYTLSGDTLVEARTLDHTGILTDLKYSPDGGYLISSDANRRIHLYQMPDYSVIIDTQWTAHTARVNSINWAPSSRYFVSGSLDTNLICFEPPKARGFSVYKGAHPMNQITRVKFLDENTVISVGQDSNLKIWTLTHS